MPYLGQSPSKGDENNFKILDNISSYTLTFDGSDASVVSAANDTITSLNHRFVQGQRVTYNKGGGTVIAGLSDGVYYIIKHDHHTIKLATSASNATNGTAVNITNVGSGSSHTLNVAFDGINTKFKATHTNGQKAKITRSAQLVVSVNGVIQQPHDTATPSTGFGFDLDGTIVLSQAPVAGDEYWAHVLTNNNVTFDISDNDVDNFTGNGSTVSFNLSKTPPDNRNVLVTIDGVVQYPNDPDGTVRAYTVVENVLTFTTAPDSNVQIQVRHIGFAGSSSASGGVTNFYGRTGSVVLKNTDNIVANNAEFAGNLTVQGTMTTLDTKVTEVDQLEVAANNTTVGVAITQSGSGDILNLYDGSTKVFSATDGGAILMGGTSSRDVGFAHKLQLEDTGNTPRAISIISNRGNQHASHLDFAKSRGGSLGSNTIVQDDDFLGHIIFRGADGTDLGSGAAKISGAVDGTPASNNIPGRLEFYTSTGGSSYERLRITKDGRLILSNSDGIQLSPKASTLYTSDGSLSYYGTNNGVYINGAGQDGWLRLSAAGTANDRTSINLLGHNYNSGGAGSDGITFRTNSNERLNIDKNGNQYFKNGSFVSFNTNGYIRLDSTGYLRLQMGSNGTMFTDPSNNELVRITTGGLVGIGTDNPSASLHLYKTSGTSLLKLENTNGSSQLDIRHTNGYGAVHYAYQGTEKWRAGQTGQFTDYSIYQSSGVGSGEDPYRFVIKNSGNVGISTHTPRQILHVNKNTGTAAVLISSPTAPQIRINPNATDSSDNDRSNFGQATGNNNFVNGAVAGDTVLRGNSTGNLLFGVGTSERLRITSGGQTLINQTSALDGAVMLGVKNPTSNDTVVDVVCGNTTAGSHIAFSDTAYARGLISYNHANNFLAFRTNGVSTDRLHITSAGKIGIDNTSPDNKLSVYDVGYCGLELKSNRSTATDNIGGVHWKTQSTNVAYLQSLVDGTIRFRNTSSLTERLRITSIGAILTGGTASEPLYPHYVTARKVQMEIKGAIDVGQTRHHGSLAVNCTNSNSSIHLVRSDNTQTDGTHIGVLGWVGYDGSDFHQAAAIEVIKGAGAGNDDQPGHMLFKTNSGTNQATEKLRITSGGQFVVGNNPTVNSGNIAHIEAPTSFNSGETIVQIVGDNAAAGARLGLQNKNTGGNTYNEILGTDAGGQSTSSIRFYNTDQSNNYGEIAFGTRSASGVPPVDRVKIHHDGEVEFITAGYKFTENNLYSTSTANDNSNTAQFTNAMTSLMGSFHGSNNTNGIMDFIDYKASDWTILEVYGKINPNVAGSGAYSDLFHMTIYKGAGYTHPNVVTTIFSVMHTPSARMMYSSGTSNNGNDGITAVWYDGSTETREFTYSNSNNAANYLRIKVPTSNFNTSQGMNFGCRIFKRF